MTIEFNNNITESLLAGKVMYIYGVMADDLRDLDYDELCFECLRISEDWVNGVNTDNFEEELYIEPYAERVLMEKFGI